MEGKKFGARVVAMLMLCAALTTVAPVASAHKCADHYTCPSDGCVNGEYHDHTDYNDPPYEDGHCESSASQPNDGCTYFTIDWPPAVCRLIETGDGGGSGGIPNVNPDRSCDTRWNVPDVGGFENVCSILWSTAP